MGSLHVFHHTWWRWCSMPLWRRVVVSVIDTPLPIERTPVCIQAGPQRLFGDACVRGEILAPLLFVFIPTDAKSGKVLVRSVPTPAIVRQIRRAILKGRAMPRGVIILEGVQPGMLNIRQHARRRLRVLRPDASGSMLSLEKGSGALLQVRDVRASRFCLWEA